MNYQEVLDFLFTQLPYFSRDGKAALKPNLNNITALCEHLGNPQNSFKSIHIAGTNGKGSTSNMLAAILQNNGYKTGLYTSPHLLDFRERIRINGIMISEHDVISFVEKIKPTLDTIKASFFEITVALCFDYFRNQKIDIAVIETGLGGRLDSTNIISPILSIITNIGFDHADLLGNTLPQIAAEKAGIIKQNTPVVIGESDILTDNVFIEKAASCNAPIYFADKNNSYYNTHFDTDLLGWYQQKNATTVMQSVDILNQQNFKLDMFKVAKALQNVKALTGFAGRYQKISSNPVIIIDTGHNEHGLKLVFQQLVQEKYENLHIIFGVVKDKDLSKILPLLPQKAQYYLCNAATPRSLPATELLNYFNPIGLDAKAYSSINESFTEALNNAKKDDVIFIGGSTFVVAEFLKENPKWN